MHAPPSLDQDSCLNRQQRLTDWMNEQGVDLVIAVTPENVQWITGQWCKWLFRSAAAITSDGKVTLVLPDTVAPSALADEIVRYEAQWHSTLRNDQSEACCSALAGAMDLSAPVVLGVEYSAFPQHLAGTLAPQQKEDLVDVEPQLYRLRRRKEADELAAIQVAIGATEKMYERARQIICPGISELEVFNQLQSAAVEHCGEMLTGTGNDYQCNSRGGPPREGVLAAAGELYILDLGPGYRGYFADNCRTIAVTESNSLQQDAWSRIMDVFQLVEETVRPGASAVDLFRQVEQLLGQAPVGNFTHHLGHGIGLFPHEAPHLNPFWDDCFEQGDVFTAEPGLYDPQLAAGMRIENNYLVTADGVHKLTNFSMEL